MRTKGAQLSWAWTGLRPFATLIYTSDGFSRIDFLFLLTPENMHKHRDLNSKMDFSFSFFEILKKNCRFRVTQRCFGIHSSDLLVLYIYIRMNFMNMSHTLYLSKDIY